MMLERGFSRDEAPWDTYGKAVPRGGFPQGSEKNMWRKGNFETQTRPASGRGRTTAWWVAAGRDSLNMLVKVIGDRVGLINTAISHSPM